MPTASGPAPQGQYLVAASEETFFVRVVGLAGMNNSAPLQEVLDDLRRQGFRQFIFDLSACTGFDSTFMGILLGAAQPREEDGAGRAGVEEAPAGEGRGGGVVLVNASDEHRRLLGEVGLDRVVRLRSGRIEFPPVELRRLEQSADPRRRIRSIVAAHENLVRLGGANVEKFGAILRTLKRELGEDVEPPG